MNTQRIKNVKDSSAIKILWSLMDELRNSMQAEESLRAIIALAVVAKINPDEFDNLYKQPKATQREYLISLLGKDPQLKVIDSLGALKERHLTTEAVQLIIYALHGVKDFTDFSEHALEAVAGKRGGEYSTESEVVELIKKLAGDLKKSVVYDAAAGLGNLASNLQCKHLRLEDINHASRDLGKNILILKGIQADYVVNDSLFYPRPSEKADLVVTQPPFGLRFSAQQQDALRGSIFIQFDQGGRIPASAGDALWIQHALYNMNDKARAMILLPQGWLFRGGYDARLRQHLLDNDLIEAIIGLPAGLLQNTSIPTALLVLNKNKTDKLRGTVHFVDASELGEKDKRKTLLKMDEINLVAALAMGAQPDHECFRAVLLPEIHKNDNDLNIKRYIEKKDVIEIPDLAEEKEKLKKSQMAFTVAQEKLTRLLSGNGG